LNDQLRHLRHLHVCILWCVPGVVSVNVHKSLLCDGSKDKAAEDKAGDDLVHGTGEQIDERSPPMPPTELEKLYLLKQEIELHTEQLGLKTELEREPPPAAKYVWVDQAAGQRLLRKSCELALESLDDYTSEHWSVFKSLYLPWGPGCVNLSRPLAMDSMLDWLKTRKIYQLTCCEMDHLVALRNHIAHPCPASTQHFDGLIKYA